MVVFVAVPAVGLVGACGSVAVVIVLHLEVVTGAVVLDWILTL